MLGRGGGSTCLNSPCKGSNQLFAQARCPHSPWPSSLAFSPSSCTHGKLACSVEDCPAASGGFGPWSPWGPCSRSCGGLGTRSRSRQCVHPLLAAVGQGCLGRHQDLEYCLSPACPGKESWREWAVPGLQRGWVGGHICVSTPFVPSCVPVPVAASASAFLLYPLALGF